MNEWRTDKPNKQGPYIVTARYCFGDKELYVDILQFGKPLMPNITGLKGWHWYYPDAHYGDIIYDNDVIAWQELPEPYTEGEE